MQKQKDVEGCKMRGIRGDSHLERIPEGEIACEEKICSHPHCRTVEIPESKAIYGYRPRDVDRMVWIWLAGFVMFALLASVDLDLFDVENS